MVSIFLLFKQLLTSLWNSSWRSILRFIIAHCFLPRPKSSNHLLYLSQLQMEFFETFSCTEIVSIISFCFTCSSLLRCLLSSLYANRSTSRPRLWRTYQRTAVWPCASFWSERWRGTLPWGALRPSCWRTRHWIHPGRTSLAAGALTRLWRRPPTRSYGSRASTTTPRRVNNL